MTDADSKLMRQFDISMEEKTVYSYKGHRYGTLQEAVNYARSQADAKTAAPRPPRFNPFKNRRMW